MPRYFEPINESELDTKIETALAKYNTEDILALEGQVAKDLSKVKFDGENVTSKNYKFGPANGLIGYHTLSNGLTFYGAAAGGDWQNPIFFIIYWDGKKLRGYIPELGNPWNTDTHEAYGEDFEKDLANARKRFGNHITEEDMEDLEIPNAEELICLDITQRIIPRKKKVVKSLSQRIENLIFYGTGDEAYELFTTTCCLAYQMYGLGDHEKAEMLVGWAEEQAKTSYDWACSERLESLNDDFEKGRWGYQ